MKKHGKVRILMQAGVAVAAPPFREHAPLRAVALEVGTESVWKALAHTPREEWPERPADESTGVVRRSRQPRDESWDAELVTEEIDPRDLPIRNTAKLIRWALDNCSWKDRQREILTAIWFDEGDVDRACSLMDLDREATLDLVLRARTMVIHAARLRDWEQEFSETRLCPQESGIYSFKIEVKPLWFLSFMAYSPAENNPAGIPITEEEIEQYPGIDYEDPPVLVELRGGMEKIEQ